MVVSGFCYWALATSSGTRWALETAAGQLDAKIQGVAGTVWDGLRVASFDMPLPRDGRVRIDGLDLRVRWRELRERRLRVANLSADAVRVDIPAPGPQEPESEPFQMPELPVSLALDRFALGKLDLYQPDGARIPVDVGNVAASLYADNNGAQLGLQSAQVGNEQLAASLEGDVRLLGMADPWPMKVVLDAQARGLVDSSPLCARNYLETLPAAEGPQDCTLALRTTVEGSLDEVALALKGTGQGMGADVQANLTPRGAFPLKDASADISLADGSSVQAKLDWQAEAPVDGHASDRLTGKLQVGRLNLAQLAGKDVIPEAMITMAADFDLKLLDRSALQSADVALAFDDASSWNKNPLSGHLKANVRAHPQARAANDSAGSQPSGQAATAQVDAGAAEPASGTQGADAGPAARPFWEGLALAAIDMDLSLGQNHLQAKGSLGVEDSSVKLDLNTPELAAFWPGLPGGASLAGTLAGTLASHKTDLVAHYAAGKGGVDAKVGEAPVDVHVVVDGGWGRGPDGRQPEGWRGTLRSLDADHAGLTVKSDSATAISFIPGAQAPAWQWQVGPSSVAVLLNSRPLVTLSHAGSRGGAGRWETQGAISQLVVSPRRIDEVRKLLGMQEAAAAREKGGVKIRGEASQKDTEITLALDWNLRFAGVLEGEAHAQRVSGDIIVPAEPAFPLELETLGLDVKIRRASATASTVTADLRVHTRRMGQATASATTLLHARDGSLYLEPKDRKSARIAADIGDLSWVSLFTGDAMEFGGSVSANLEVESRPDGSWNSSGIIEGSKLRVVRVDDGVRLLDGTLAARIADNRLILDKLSFPARLRAKPKEWRTEEWVTTNPDAQNGSVTITGEWDLLKSTGDIDINLYRYPILQRADRYAMLTGKLRLSAVLPRMSITGSVTADAGWFDLDMLGGIPTVDSDVVVIRPGETLEEPSAPLDLSMDLEVDLGPRFYLTGYGVNSGLRGNLHITMAGNKLTGIGALNTRGGAIETYGQRLQLRRGTITFQGDIANPILDIEALRTGLAVEAGVRVAGTARRPKIDLISYPAVSEIEKLSWLLLGHGPDDSGGDVALLFSVGSSFLSDGEPFYRKFGIDEISMRSGELGGSGSILPAESVVKGLDDSASDIERRFVIVSKGVANNLTLSLRQALSDTGTVGHLSYRLTRRLTAELSVGTVSGLALVYRWFSRD